MRRLHIFGCSYSAEYSKSDYPFEAAKAYIEAEEQLGNLEVQTLSYWFKELIEEDIVIFNYAKGGNSNDQIFHDFFKYSSRIRPGDYILFQLSILTRMRVCNLVDGSWINLQTPVSKAKEHMLTNFTNYSLETTNRFCFERTSLPWFEYIKDSLQMVRQYCDLSGAILCVTSLEPSLQKKSIVDLPRIYNKEFTQRIEDKFPHMDDRHPTYEGNRNIAQTVLDYFKLLEIKNNKKTVLSDEQIVCIMEERQNKLDELE